MLKDYEYYINNIKPLEKQYSKFCLLYSIFKWKYFYQKKLFYNKLLINYYKIIKDNQKIIKNLSKNF